MEGTVIVAIVSGACTLGGAFFGVVASSKLTNHRLEQLEKRVEKHNNLVERMVAVEHRSSSNTHRLNKLDGKKTD